MNHTEVITIRLATANEQCCARFDGL